MTTPLTDLQIKQLTRDLNPARVAQRSQGGAKLSYLEAWDVRATLIRVFGFGMWSADVLDAQIIRLDEVPASQPGGKPQWRALAQATVRLTIFQTGATYTESAAQSQRGPDIGEVTDFAIKTAESDALKRAAMNLGTQFGLSLYDNGTVRDVVKVLLSPGQHEALERIKNPEKQEEKETHEQAQARVRASGERGEIVALPAPGEDPRDDLELNVAAMRQTADAAWPDDMNR